MQSPNQRREQVYLLTQAFGYVFASLFLLTFEATDCLFWVLKVIGFAFFVASIFLVISPLSRSFIRCANRIDNYLNGGLFATTLALFTKTIIDLIAGRFTILAILALIWIILFDVALILLQIRSFRKSNPVPLNNIEGGKEVISTSLPSLDLVFELTKNHYDLSSKWADSLDSKTVSVFSVGALLISVITAIGAPKIMCNLQTIMFLIAVCAFVATAIFSWKAYQVKNYFAALHPKVLLEEFASRNIDDSKYWLVKYAGQHWEYNKSILDSKAQKLHIAMVCVGIEVLFLIIWIILA